VTQTQANNGKTANVTMAVSVSLAVAGIISIAVGLFFAYKRFQRRRAARAETPPGSPLGSKFDPGAIATRSVPIWGGATATKGEGMWNSGKQDTQPPFNQESWDEKISVEWGEKGHQRYGSGSSAGTLKVHELPAELDSGEPIGVARSESLNQNQRQRETMRVFPNGRQKLGGKELENF
jgi:hypothetical protein